MTDPVANRNFLKPNRSSFVLMRTPAITYYCQTSTLPSIDLGTATQENPFSKISYPGDKLVFNDVTLDFLVDEDMVNYMEIYNWMIAIGYPDNFNQYQKALTTNLATQQALASQSPFSDGTLVVNTSANNLNLRFRFIDMYPTNLGTVSFTTKAADPVVGQVTFRYRKFDLVDNET